MAPMKKGPNKGKQRKTPVTKRNYSPTKLHQALEEVKTGLLSARKAANKYGIPRSTLGFRNSPKFVKPESGPSTILTKDEEKSLVNWVIECGKKGFPRRRLDLQQSVQGFLQENTRKNPFANNRPGKTWLYSFLKRHPELTFRTSEAVTQASSTISKERIAIWFSSVEELLEKEGHIDILKDPTRIFNGDETNFLLWPKNSRVLAPKGCRNVYEVDGGAAKSSLTAMFSFSASGESVPPMIVYPYKRLPQDIIRSVPEGWGIGRSDSGWMTSEIFYEYVANIFNRFLEDRKIKKPVILFVDGHKSHLNYQLSQLCSHLNIILVALYPNSTRILQPADVAAFKPLKEGWKKAVLEFKSFNPNKQITKVDVAPLLSKVVSTNLKKETLKNGFRASGLFPWNHENIDFSKCLGSNHNIEVSQDKDVHRYILSREQLLCIVGERVARDVTNNLVFETCSATPKELFSALKSICTYLDTSSYFANKESRPSTTSDLPQVVGMPPGDSVEVAETSCDDIIVMDPEPGPSFVPLPVDDVPNHEASQALDPIVLKKTTHGPIDGWLVWPKTPEKKEKRVQKMMPYVITSRAWQIEKEDEIMKKEEARKIKEERATKRKLAKESKEESKAKKKQPQKKIPERPQRRLSFSDGEEGNKDDDDDEVVVESDTEKHFRMDGPSCPIDDLEIDSNDDFIRGMCFVCTRSLNAVNPGRACEICDKLFHNACENLVADSADIKICSSCNNLSEVLLLGVDEVHKVI